MVDYIFSLVPDTIVMLTYKPLLKLLMDRNLKEQDLVDAKVISLDSMAKINKNEIISLDLIEKLCAYLNCQPGDIVEYIPHIVSDDANDMISVDDIGSDSVD